MLGCIKDLEEKLNEKNKALDVKAVECNKFKKETVECKNRLAESKELLDKKKTLMEFKCMSCDMKFKSAVECSQHVREIHAKDQVSQTTEPNKIVKEFDAPYPCFYCGFYFTQNKDVLDHRLKCTEPVLVFQDEFEQSFLPSHRFFIPPSL